MLICRRITEESLLQNIDFHTAGVRDNIGAGPRPAVCASTSRLWSVTKEIASLLGPGGLGGEAEALGSISREINGRRRWWRRRTEPGGAALMWRG